MKTRIHFLTFAAYFVCATSLSAQESAAQRHEAATNQLKRIAAEISAHCLSDIGTLDEWKQRRPELRHQLLEMLGLDPLPARTPLKAQITGRIEQPEYRIEKVVFQSLPRLYVTGNFYVPKTTPAKRLPTILYLCGHSPHPLGAKYQYQDRAIWFAAHGYPCLVLDTFEFGEIAGIHHGTHDLDMWNWLSLGYTPAGVEVWNAIRALDYLETRPEVDAKRIGLTGISGGGAMTWYTAAVDERIAAAVPVCSTFTFGSQADHWVARGQCDCIYYHNTYGWDFPIVGALIAPRPLLILSGQKDSIFPPDGYHAAFQRARKVYDLYAGASSDRIRELDDNVPHSDPPLFLREARQWMQRWLKDDTKPLPLETNTPPKIDAEKLACLDNVQADAINYRIQNHFTSPVSLKAPSSRSAWDRRRGEVIAGLRDKVFRWFPTKQIPFETKMAKSGGGWVVRYGYADYKDYSFQSEEGVRIRAQLFTPKNDDPTVGRASPRAARSGEEARGDARPTGPPLLIYARRMADSVYSSDSDELLPLMGRYSVLIVNPRLTEQALTPAENTDVERTAAWTGRTIAAMQTWDILRTIEWAVNEQKIPASSISIYGKGEMGIIALYASLYDERIQQVILSDSPPSHWQGPALLNVLRVTDIPEAAAALAPRRLVSLTPFPESFDYTKRIYRVKGAQKQLMQASSLPEALEVWKHSRSR